MRLKIAGSRIPATVLVVSPPKKTWRGLYNAENCGRMIGRQGKRKILLKKNRGDTTIVLHKKKVQSWTSSLISLAVYHPRCYLATSGEAASAEKGR